MYIIYFLILSLLLLFLTYMITEDRKNSKEEKIPPALSDFDILCFVILAIIPVINILFIATIIYLVWFRI